MSYKRVNKTKTPTKKKKATTQQIIAKKLSPEQQHELVRKKIKAEQAKIAEDDYDKRNAIYKKLLSKFWQGLTFAEKNEFLKNKAFYTKLNFAKLDKPQASKSLLTQKEYPGFLANKTGMSFYDDMFSETRYFEVAKSRCFTLVEMTADEYLKECYEMFLKFDGEKYTTWESATATFPNSVKKYTKMMKDGVKFNMPMIDWDKGGQEGRNRAEAFKKTFGEDAKMPVMVVHKYVLEEREPLYAMED